MILSLMMKTALHLLFTVLSYMQGALQKNVWTACFTEHVQEKVQIFSWLSIKILYEKTY